MGESPLKPLIPCKAPSREFANPMSGHSVSRLNSSAPPPNTESISHKTYARKKEIGITYFQDRLIRHPGCRTR